MQLPPRCACAARRWRDERAGHGTHASVAQRACSDGTGPGGVRAAARRTARRMTSSWLMDGGQGAAGEAEGGAVHAFGGRQGAPCAGR
eukprot:5699676-Prymnesium_polylepis.1